MHITYNSAQFTDCVKRFRIASRIDDKAAEFTLLVQAVAPDGRTRTYRGTYSSPIDLLHDLRNGWYSGRGVHEPAYIQARRDLAAYVDGLADAGLSVSRINR